MKSATTTGAAGKDANRVAARGPELEIALLGLGAVGRALLEALAPRVPGDGPGTTVGLRVVAASDSRRQLRDAGGIAATECRARLAASAEPADADRLTDWLLQRARGPAAICDLTADEGIARRHAEWLTRGIHVVTANKIAAAAASSEWRALRRAATRGSARYLDSTTVGAGLPVLAVLDRMHAAGDEVRAIRGIFSGSLSHLAVAIDQGVAPSEALREAQRLGLTEPDPRLDLGGLDVARKLVIAARHAGHALCIEAVEVEDLVPPALRPLSLAGFLARVDELDAALAPRIAAARARGRVLRHVGQVDGHGRAAVALIEVADDDPLAQVGPGDNCVAISSRRYDASPLVIRGPGAGPSVTAGGVLADLISLLPAALPPAAFGDAAMAAAGGAAHAL